jgi:hypothetical protein
MTVIFDAALAVALLLIVSWVAIFGTIGGLLSHTRDGSAIEGFVLGALLGPFGWVFTWFRTREAAGRRIEETDTGSDGWSTL